MDSPKPETRDVPHRRTLYINLRPDPEQDLENHMPRSWNRGELGYLEILEKAKHESNMVAEEYYCFDFYDYIYCRCVLQFAFATV
jgi:hypothetical protein